MGFTIDDKFLDLKQHLNLSESAWLIVEQDIKNFYPSEKEESKSGFFNTILKNFYETANASINMRCANKKEELLKVFNSKNFNEFADDMIEAFIEKTLEVYRKELEVKATSYNKGHGEKFRINIENVSLLKNDIHEQDFYYDAIGLYLKPLFEEYCEKPNYEREKIFFKDTISEIDSAIREQKKLKLAIRAQYNADSNTYYTRRFLVSPYKIMQDDTKSYNYLVCLSEEVLEDGTVTEKKPSSFRISRIDKIRKMSSMSGFIAKERKDELEEEIIKKKAQFLLGELKDVKVKFTRVGLESYKRLLYLRPQNIIEKDGLVYVFRCTELQAENYFIKFGKEAEILEPISLRERIIKKYSEAVDVYKK